MCGPINLHTFMTSVRRRIKLDLVQLTNTILLKIYNLYSSYCSGAK